MGNRHGLVQKYGKKTSFFAVVEISSLLPTTVLAHLASTFTQRRKNYKKRKEDNNYVAVFADLGVMRKDEVNFNDR